MTDAKLARAAMIVTTVDVAVVARTPRISTTVSKTFKSGRNA